MTYEFVTPRLAEPQSTGRSLPWTLVPVVPVVRSIEADRCTGLADIAIKAHEDGQSWPSRTRYAGSGGWDVNNEFRSSKNLPPALNGLSSAYESLDAYARQAMQGFGLDEGRYHLKTVDEQCLVYQSGDHIGDHSDDSALLPGDEELWQVIKPERHFVGIVWLTTQTAQGTGRHEFAGGTFRFNSLVHTQTGEPLEIHPTAGAMIFFPANPWFRHEVLRVTAGTRIALTRWWQAIEKSDEPR